MTAIVFDLFHTLVDPELFRPTGFDQIATIAITLDVDERAVRRSWTDGYEERETTCLDPADQLTESLRASGLTLPAGARREIDRILGVTRDPALLSPDPEVTDLLGELSGRHRVAVLSNCHQREIRCWPDSPLAPLVDGFIASSRIGLMKPSVEAYLHTCRELDVAPAASVFVGNGSSGELSGARDAGFGRVVHANHYDRSNGLVTEEAQRARASQADDSAQTIGDLRSILIGPRADVGRHRQRLG